MPNATDQPPGRQFGNSQCPRCGGQLVCYVSSPTGWKIPERRLYFSCRCGIIAVRSEKSRMIGIDRERKIDGLVSLTMALGLARRFGTEYGPRVFGLGGLTLSG